MRRSSKPLPKDPNQLAAEIVRLSTEPYEESAPPEPSTLSAYFAAMGRKGGLKGGKARAKNLSAGKRKAIAKNAAKTRWAKKAIP
jgi:hypothetical protein